MATSNLVLMSKLLKVIAFAAEAHKYKKRKARTKSLSIPYINHPVDVANNIAEAAALNSQFMSKNNGSRWLLSTLKAAIMHDVIEDTENTEADILLVSDQMTTDIILEVTDPEEMPSDTAERKMLQAKKAETYSIGATNLKISDQTMNIRDIIRLRPKWNEQKILAYVDGAIAIVEATPEAYRMPELVRRFYAVVELVRLDTAGIIKITTLK